MSYCGSINPCHHVENGGVTRGGEKASLSMALVASLFLPSRKRRRIVSCALLFNLSRMVPEAVATKGNKRGRWPTYGSNVAEIATVVAGLLMMASKAPVAGSLKQVWLAALFLVASGSQRMTGAKKAASCRIWAALSRVERNISRASLPRPTAWGWYRDAAAHHYGDRL